MDGIKFYVQGENNALGHACFEGIVSLGGKHQKWKIGWDSTYSRYKIISTYYGTDYHCSNVIEGELCFSKSRWTTSRYLHARDPAKIGGDFHEMSIDFLDAQTHKSLNLRGQD